MKMGRFSRGGGSGAGEVEARWAGGKSAGRGPMIGRWAHKEAGDRVSSLGQVRLCMLVLQEWEGDRISQRAGR